MSLRASDQRIDIGRSFALYWMLSLAVPVILAWPVIDMMDDVRIGNLFLESFYLRFVAIILFWLAVGYIQSRLLIRRLPRRRLWLIVTGVGGCLGLFGAMAADSWVNGAVISLCSPGCQPSSPVYDWLWLVRYDWLWLVPTAVPGAAAGLILGFLQSICFDGTWRARLLWLAASALGGFAAVLAGAIWQDAFSWIVRQMGPESPVSRGGLWGIVFSRHFIETVVAFAVFGLSTGIALRRFLLYRARRQQALVLGQFD